MRTRGCAVGNDSGGAVACQVRREAYGDGLRKRILSGRGQSKDEQEHDRVQHEENGCYDSHQLPE